MTERDPLVLIQESLTEDETAQFLAVTSRWPGMDGARVADVLAQTTDNDAYLPQTEVFYDRHGDELPAAAPNTAALHLLIILGRELTMENLTGVLTRAGLMPAAPPPRLRWRRVFIGRAARGYSADGAELHYLVFLSPDGHYRLTRYPRNGQHTGDIMSAAASAVVVPSPEEGRRLAELFEAGESIPEIGWFPAAGQPGGEMHTFLHPIEPGALIQHGTVTGRLPRTQADTDADEFREEILRARREEGT